MNELLRKYQHLGNKSTSNQPDNGAGRTDVPVDSFNSPATSHPNSLSQNCQMLSLSLVERFSELNSLKGFHYVLNSDILRPLNCSYFGNDALCAGDGNWR